MTHAMYLERDVVVDSQMIEAKEQPATDPRQVSTAVATKGDKMFELLHDLIIDETGNKSIESKNSFLHKRLIGEWTDDIMLNNILYFRLQSNLPKHIGSFNFTPIDRTLTWAQLKQIGLFLFAMETDEISDARFLKNREELLDIIAKEEEWRNDKELDARLKDSTVTIEYRYWTVVK